MAGSIAAWILVLGLGALPQPFPVSQIDSAAELKAFQVRLDQYVEVHRRLEGPLPPLVAAPDMGEVRRLMDALRMSIRAERRQHAAGTLIGPGMAAVLRGITASTLTLEDITEMSAELDEHTPPGMPFPRVNEALPEGAPFCLIPPQLLRVLPRLPPELRYVVVRKALVIWDSHADLVVDLVPGLFDPLSYIDRKSGTLR